MDLPDWLDPLYDAAGQRAADAWAIEDEGIAALGLMESAGEQLAAHACTLVPAGRVAVVCGKGNNGGDGLVAARHLRAAGREVDVLLVGDPDAPRGGARANLERLPGPPPAPFGPGASALGGAALIIDALLGTGFAGAPRPDVAAAIDAINGAGAPVVACDIASGVDATSGEVAGVAVRAVLTVTFDRAKVGHWIAPGKGHAGRVEVVDIGIPAERPVAPAAGLICARALAGIPHRDQQSTKFASGAVLVVGGSAGLSGAPRLAAEGAMRAGAGYVTACVPAPLAGALDSALVEAMVLAVPDSGGALRLAAVDAVLARAPRADAVVLGPGLGAAPVARACARQLAALLAVALVLDADGLNAQAGRAGALLGRVAPTVLTPHAGELARLLGCGPAEVAARRRGCALEAARRAGAIVVLKGDDTLVAAPDGRLAISPGGAPSLATAGTGDVLAGVIGALLAKRMEPFHAACAAVHAHVQAGRRAAAAVGSADGVIARDVIGQLPRAMAASGSGL